MTHQPYYGPPPPAVPAPAPARRRPFKRSATNIVVGIVALGGGHISLVAAYGLAVEGDPTAELWAHFGAVLLLGAVTNLGVAAYRVANRIDYLYRNVGGP
ncbi:hypothetical protein [Cellulosimicrobium sp. Marseille-Q4280]|uniref:hypothetical protein n=1 Tax=Cellulosimicrobium sp. Marseille-Q4280 TaxID=2937992 RepID=UPI002041B74F|nr:hypothetical protein [Cellulosimicrobium sp. Marseille-Q4280]